MPDVNEATVELDLKAPEEDTTLDAEETTETEDSTESEESTEAEDTTEETDAESEDDDSESTKTGTDDEGLEDADWLKQFDGMPEGIKSMEDLGTSYVEALKDMKRTQTGDQKLQQLDIALRSRGFAAGVDGLLSGEAPQFDQLAVTATQSQKGESYFDTSPVKGVVEAMIDEGRIRDTEESPANVATYKHLAQVFDQAIGPQLKKFEDVYNGVGSGLSVLFKKVRDLEWAGLDESVREGISRTEVDALLDKNLFTDYEKAIQYMTFSQPGLLSKMASQAQKKGEEKGLKKLKRSSKAIRRGKKQSQTRSYDYDKFLMSNGDWDMDAIGKVMSIDKGIAMIERYEKEHPNK